MLGLVGQRGCRWKWGVGVGGACFSLNFYEAYSLVQLLVLHSTNLHVGWRQALPYSRREPSTECPPHSIQCSGMPL